MSRYKDQPDPSNPDLQDYYDVSELPPPHRLSTVSQSNVEIPLVPTSADSRGDHKAAAGDMRSQPTPYQYNSPSNHWLEQQQARKKRSRMIVIGSILALIGLVIAGIVAGVVVAKNKSGRANGAAKSGASGAPGTSNNPNNQTDPNDPSTFTRDPRLKQSFYGLAYQPEGSLLPNCGNTLAQVITDIQLISQLTKRIRLYGSDCNQSALVLEAIKRTKVDLNVYLGNYNNADDNGVAYLRQRALIIDAIKTYGTDHIAGVTVGNEFMLNYVTEKGITDVNSAAAQQGAAILIANIADTRATLGNLSLAKTPPVGNSDAGAYFNTNVLSAIDYGLANVHPWFAGVTIDDAAAWTASFFQTTDVQAAALLPNNPKMYIAETGWPTQSSNASSASDGASLASVPNLQIFLDTFVCQANANGTAYFFFEYFDETWKDVEFGGVEGWWGLFKADRTLKNITIPDCPSP